MSRPADLIAAIVRTDLLLRFRRTASIVTLLAVAAGVYLIVPDIRTGRTLMQIDGERVIYNSAAVALGTAMFCGLLLTMAGYYLVSNTVKRDVVSRTGFIIAATPVTSLEYVIGKFTGSFLMLAAIAMGCMLSAMVMFLIRGEGSLEPIVFLTTYAWTIVPGIAFASAMAIAFESLPLLSGRFGDVLYFFLWAGLLGMPIGLFENGIRMKWLGALDIMGLVVLIGQIQDQFHTTTMSIGSSSFNVLNQSPVLYPGLQWGWEMIAMRFASLAVPAGLILLARAWFHRFNPARIKVSVRHSRRNLIGRINTLLKPVTRILAPLASLRIYGLGAASLPNAVLADVFATLLLSPLTVVAIIVFAVLSLSLDLPSLRAGALPAMFVVLILALADITVRDGASGMMNLLCTAPKLKKHYVSWKLGSALLTTTILTSIPAARLLTASPSAGVSLCIGSCFIAVSAVGFGVLAGSQKLFMAVFLMLLYVTLSAPDSAVFDFAGFSGTATPGVQIAYAALAILAGSGGYIRHRLRIRNL